MAKKKIETISWGNLEKSMQDNHARRFDAILVTMDDEEFAKNYLKALEFFKPKIQRQEIVEETILDRTIKVEYIESESDKDANSSK